MSKIKWDGAEETMHRFNKRVVFFKKDIRD